MIDRDEHDEHDQGYFGDVEAYFVGRRGSPLFITPAEWFLVSKWEEQGIPLDVVREGIDRVFERPQAAAKPRKLGYCRQTIEAAFRRFREVTLGGGENRGPAQDHFDAATHLSRLSSELGRLAVAPDLAARVEALGDSGETRQRIEDALTALDDELMENAENALDENDRDALLSDAGASLASYRDRMPDKVYQSALRSAYRRRLRDKAKLPRLSLYDR